MIDENLCKISDEKRELGRFEEEILIVALCRNMISITEPFVEDSKRFGNAV